MRMVIMPVTVVVIIAVALRMASVGMIGAPRRLEGLADLGHLSPKPFKHGADDMIAQDEDAFLLNLRR